MINDKIISALVGLCGAKANNGKTDNTDSIVMKALLGEYDESDVAEIALQIKKDKFTISPNCETCATPCGNTSDYDMTRFYEDLEIKDIREELITETSNLIQRIYAKGIAEVPDIVFQAISYFGYELATDSYKDLIEKIKQTEV